MDTTRYRAPKKLPSVGDLCQDIRDGITTAELAQMYEVGKGWIRTKIRDAGYDPNTGRAPQRPARTSVLPVLGTAPDWMNDARCAQTDPEAFYPEKGGTAAPGKAVCRDCTVRAECLTWALDHDERYGVWGGLSERERRPLTKQAKTTKETS